VVLYQLLAGRLPYETGSLTELAMRQQEGTPEPLHLLNEDVSPELSRAVTRSLAARPEHRYASAAEFGQALREGARGRDSAVTMLLETAAASVAAPAAGEAATNVLQPMPAPLPAPAPAPSRPAPRSARRTARASRPEPKQRRRRGAFTRFMALMFLFLLIAAVVAAVVIVNLDSGTQDFERVVSERVQDQIDGIRKLIEDATQ
jgi:predicted component of type VI protein secretion system